MPNHKLEHIAFILDGNKRWAKKNNINLKSAYKKGLENISDLIINCLEINLKYLKDLKNILLISPLSYPEFIWLMNRSKIIITDSGGVQEEAPSLGKPVLVMRENTERPEAVDAGTVILVGTNKEKIVNTALDLLDNKERFQLMSELHNPYGDGKACSRIIDFLKI